MHLIIVFCIWKPNIHICNRSYLYYFSSRAPKARSKTLLTLCVLKQLVDMLSLLTIVIVGRDLENIPLHLIKAHVWNHCMSMHENGDPSEIPFGTDNWAVDFLSFLLVSFKHNKRNKFTKFGTVYKLYDIIETLYTTSITKLGEQNHDMYTVMQEHKMSVPTNVWFAQFFK